jgi:GDSL-like Lipase/Acylhydrolase family
MKYLFIVLVVATIFIAGCVSESIENVTPVINSPVITTPSIPKTPAQKISEIVTVVTKKTTPAPTAAVYPSILVGAGDSITLGYTTVREGYKSYFSYIHDVNPTWELYDAGYSGIGAATLLNRYYTDVRPNNTNYVLFEEGNSIILGDSLATIKKNWLHYNDMAAANGTTVYFNTIPPRTGSRGYTDAQNITRTQLNAWLRCNFTADHGNRYFIDLDVILTDPSNASQMLPVYTYDGTHLNDLGYMVWGTNISTTFPETSPVC